MMATACAPERPADASTINMLGNPVDQFGDPEQYDDAPNETSPPLPNPPFVFPARMAVPTSAPPSLSRATGRIPMSTIEPHNQIPSAPQGKGNKTRRPVALPNFSFNPGADLSPQALSPLDLSSPSSPVSPNAMASPLRPAGAGHRRGGSEFVGGRLREGNSIAVMSTSPTKSESGFASPGFQPPKRSHRRGLSSNISIHDLPSLHPPWDPSLMKGSSAPTSPTNFENTMGILHIPDDLPKLVEASRAAVTRSASADDGSQLLARNKAEMRSGSDSKPSKPPTRTRVGFSDTLEFIPRPLSLVNSDTSSVATARPGHSLSGSISSIVSASSPSGRESPAPLALTSTRDTTDSRPSTAGAVLERWQDDESPAGVTIPKRRNSIPALLDVADTPDVALPEPSPSRAKRWSFFGLDPFVGASSPTRARPASSSSSDTARRVPSGGSSSDLGSESAPEPFENDECKSKKSKKDKKKKRRKGWAGAILPRKSGGKKSKSTADRPPTPPPSNLPADDEDDNKTDKETSTTTTPTIEISELPSWSKPAAGSKRSMDDSSYQMIDLDAALGPFNTPLPNNPEWDAAQRAAGSVGGKRRLHSAQGMKGFGGPGMHYHRRAESAPDLPPFDMGRSSIHRFGSSSTMADVFEEEEEEEVAGKNKSKSADDSSDMGDDYSDGDVTPPAAMPQEHGLGFSDNQPMVRRQSSGLSDREPPSTPSIHAQRSKTSLQDSIIHEEPLKSTSSPPPHSLQSASSFDFAHKPSSRIDSKPPDIISIPVNHQGPLPISPYSMSHSSSYPSPRSPVSIDAQRISTAPSSVTDENNFQSLLLGEPGPEVRLSIDYDMPSLTSSNSTMTRDSNSVPQLRRPRPGAREERPQSVSSAFGHRRASLASLSRLISSSHGERSKLSMEVTLDNDEKKQARTSKTKRLSKMMQFWKSDKEKTEA